MAEHRTLQISKRQHLVSIDGFQDADQYHLQQYTQPDIKRTRTTAFCQCEKCCHQHGFPGLVYVPFLCMYNIYCSRYDPVFQEQIHPQIQEVVQEQEAMEG